MILIQEIHVYKVLRTAHGKTESSRQLRCNMKLLGDAATHGATLDQKL